MKLIPRCQPGYVLQLTPEEQRYLEWSKMSPEQRREYRTNRAKSHLQSGPSITNFWEAFQTYIGNRDPENPHLNTGEAPSPGMRNPKQVAQTVQKAKTIAERVAKISDKVFDRQYQRAISSGNSKRVQAVRDLHFKGKSKSNTINTSYHGQTMTNKMYEDRNINPYNDKREFGYFSSTSEPVANTYNFVEGSPTFKLYTYSKNPYITDVKGASGSRTLTDRTYIQKTREGYDGIILKNISDAGIRTDRLNGASRKADDIITIPGRAKLKDAITYDNNGNIIPISQRDNFSIFDIRYKKGGKL